MRVGDKRHNLPQERFEYKVASPSNDLFSEKSTVAFIQEEHPLSFIAE